jgi:polar amino acid transport system permease protein
MQYQFNWSVLWGDYGLRLIDGLFVTLHLIGYSLGIAFAIGLVFGIARWVGGRVLSPICWAYVEFVRNTPLLVQILFWYFSAAFILPKPVVLWLRDLGFEFASVVIALAIYHGAFLAEVVRAGLNSIHSGQYDAARALGLSFPQMMASIVLPQAFRILVPPLTNETVSLTKNTSLALAIGVTEIAYQAKYIESYTFRAVEALCAATVLYLVLCLSLTGLGHLASLRLSRHIGKRHAVGVGLE